LKLARYLERINEEIQQASTLMERDCLRNVNLTYNNQTAYQTKRGNFDEGTGKPLNKMQKIMTSVSSSF